VSRYTPAYTALLQRLYEVEQLRILTSKSIRLSPRPHEAARAKALYRAAIVLLCSHIEGYIEELCTLAIDGIHSKQIKKSKLSNAFFFYFSRDIIEEIKNTSDPSAISLKVKGLYSRDLDIWDSTQTFSRLWA
jgi:hypothetical protein